MREADIFRVYMESLPEMQKQYYPIEAVYTIHCCVIGFFLAAIVGVIGNICDSQGMLLINLLCQLLLSIIIFGVSCYLVF